jgi:hypothetical protein
MSEYEFQVGDHPHVEVRVSSGRLAITEGDPGSVVVKVSGRDADRILVEQMGDTIAIVEPRDTRIMRRGPTVTIRFSCPPGCDLSVGVASLDVDASQVLGRVAVRTASGDARFGQVGSVELKSASGDVYIRRCQGEAQIGTASGDVRIESVGGELQASLSSGDLWVGTLDTTGEIRSASGDVQIDRLLGTSIAVASVSGDVVVGVPGGQRVDADISTMSGRLSLPERTPQSDEPKRTIRLRLKTVSGDIRVNRL